MARTSHRPAAAPAWALILALVFGLATLAAAASSARAGVERMDFGAGRQLIVYMPAHLPPPGQRALVVVLHGGLGNADRIEFPPRPNTGSTSIASPRRTASWSST